MLLLKVQREVEAETVVAMNWYLVGRVRLNMTCMFTYDSGERQAFRVPSRMGNAPKRTLFTTSASSLTRFTCHNSTTTLGRA